MKLHELKPAEGSVKRSKRLGRGIGSGKGRTSARGHKGAQSRSGYKRKRNFEGGQMPLQMRIPKRGFKSRNRTEYVPMNFGRLSEIAEKYSQKEITFEFLCKTGIVRKNDLVKILSDGELTNVTTVEAHKISKKAQEGLETAGISLKLI